MHQNLQQNKGLVESVFNTVFDKYDLMNDLMSFGVHRIWKKELIYMMNPSNKKKLIDVASGTGDVAELYSKSINNSNEFRFKINQCTDEIILKNLINDFF